MQWRFGEFVKSENFRLSTLYLDKSEESFLGFLQLSEQIFPGEPLLGEFVENVAQVTRL